METHLTEIARQPELRTVRLACSDGFNAECGYDILRGFSIVYLCYLAWKIATAPIGTSATEATSAPSPWSGFILSIANPKAFAAIGAVYASQNLIENNLLLDSAAKVVALSVLIVLAAFSLAIDQFFVFAIAISARCRLQAVFQARYLITGQRMLKRGQGFEQALGQSADILLFVAGE